MTAEAGRAPRATAGGDDTPLIAQWREIKARQPDTLLLFRVGDFYEMFNEDAEEGARLLDLTLTSRNNGSSRAPLAGIPAHALDVYLQRLVAAGRRVAVCEQMEEVGGGKLVRREVVETVTPGVVLTDALLDARRNNFLAAVHGDLAAGGELVVASADLSTGELLLERAAYETLPDTLGRIGIAELLLPSSWELASEPWARGCAATYRPDWIFDARSGSEELRRRFGVLETEGFGIDSGDALALGACGALLHYLEEVQPGRLGHLRPPRMLAERGALALDEMTRRNLELVEPLRGGEGRTLLQTVDATLTPMGARLLRQRLLRPSLRRDEIELRLAAVEELVVRSELRRGVRRALGEVRDLERLAAKAAAGRMVPREMGALRASLRTIPRLQEEASAAADPHLRQLAEACAPLPELVGLLERALEEELPGALGEGGVMRSGFDAGLDGLRELRDGAVDWIARLQERERARTGISSLKVGFNRVFGYFLEVTHANLEKVPDDYHRKQTLSNAERYFTPELKEWEQKVLGAEEGIAELERKLYAALRDEVASWVSPLQALAAAVAALDVLAGLAETASRQGYVRPRLHDGFELEIRGGRHPVVETALPAGQFVPNDVVLGEEARVMILTGPNMAGKSTILRQTGLIVLLAQIGSFVPAASARVGIVDRLFTRVGASDDLARGRSTFMVEMSETAAILHGASRRSLVLLDEVGRGTSTWDGISVATAATEHLHDRLGCKTIFATHYHELTQLAERLSGVVNFNVEVREVEDRILFLRRLLPGGADRSYGVEVARLAGLPDEVVKRARGLLAELEGAAAAGEPGRGRRAQPARQLALFADAENPVLDRLRQLDLDRITPLEAINLLHELAGTLRDGDTKKGVVG
jgi:DNA mismatch repair protein MutS